MISSFIRTTALAVVAVTLLASGPARADMTKEQVEQIVRDYIANNGDQILKSVATYQSKASEARFADAVKTNREALFKDEKAPFIGNEKGDVTVVEFFDYNCGYCKRVLPTVQQLLNEDKKIKFVFKDLPILGPTSETAAKWALAVHKQGKYFEFYQKMMENKQPITDELLADVTKSIGADVAKAKADAESSDVLLQIERNKALAQQMNLNGTPAFVIGDTVIPGAADIGRMKQAIDLARKSDPTAANAPSKP